MSLLESFPKASEIIIKSGLEPTLNRIMVFSALSQCEHPLTARDVYERLRREHKLNRVTVYRILDLFADKGLVNKISSGERSFCYCSRSGRWLQGHCHFHCTKCGEVQCLDTDLLSFNEQKLSRLPNEIHHIELRLDGVCAHCKGQDQF